MVRLPMADFSQIGLGRESRGLEVAISLPEAAGYSMLAGRVRIACFNRSYRFTDVLCYSYCVFR